MYLGWKCQTIDGMLRSFGVCLAEMNDDFVNSELIGKRSTADVDVRGARVIQRQFDVMSGVDQCATYLKFKKDRPTLFVTTRKAK